MDTVSELLRFSVPTLEDLPALFEICSDPRVWMHKPSARHANPAQTRALLETWADGWERHGLGAWIVTETSTAQVIGYGGCSLVGDSYWNLGYRLASSAHGKGHATEIAQRALGHARRNNSSIPVVASVLEHNIASVRVASKIGLKLAYRGADRGNPDPVAVRQIYADRVLEFEQLAGIIAPEVLVRRS